MPPLLNIPARTRDLEAVQRGRELIVRWTVPDKTTEDMPLKDLGRAVLLAAEDEAGLESGARELAVLEEPEPGRSVERRLPLNEEPGRRLVLAVKNYSRRGRSEGHSNTVTIEVAAPPPAPARLTARTRADGVALEWDAAHGASGYQVFRSGPDDGEFARLADVEANRYTDREVRWKARYRYFVRPFVRTATGAAEGADSPVAEVTPEDVFPPSTPGGLQVVVSESAADLSWSLSPEPDTAGYHVWRDGRRLTAAQPLGAPAYTDRAVQRGQTYSYQISAVDALGNESPPSEAVKVTIP